MIYSTDEPREFAANNIFAHPENFSPVIVNGFTLKPGTWLICAPPMHVSGDKDQLYWVWSK